MMNNCDPCEFGHFTMAAQEKSGSIVVVECLHWDRPTNPFFIKASDSTPENCPKIVDKLCKICGQGPDIDHNGCIIIGMHR